MNYTFIEISNIVNAEIIQHQIDSSITHVSVDSRKHSNSESTLFIAIIGENNNGNNYIKELYNKGVRNYIISQKINVSEFKNANFCFVNNGIKALQEIAKHHRKKFKIPVIGVTGSNGKTIVKEWLYTLLKDDYNIIRSPKSYNSQIGVALSVLGLNEHHTLAIFEAGISQPNEMEMLKNIIDPTFGVLTMLGNAHLNNFSSISELKNEKYKLFSAVDKLVKYSPEFELNSNDLSFDFNNEKVKIKIPFIDKASAQNCITCYKVLHELGVSENDIQTKILDLSNIAMRLEILEGINNNILINDAYNSDLKGLEIALDALKNQAFSTNKKMVLVLSDLESGKSFEKEYYSKIIELLNRFNLESVVFVGQKFQSYKELIFTNVINYTETIEEADVVLKEIYDSVILLKGARKFEFEKAINLLQKQNHKTYFEVNLNSLQKNLKAYRSKIASQKIMVMLKANAYGCGIIEVAKKMSFNKVDYFGVAYADEGVLLRDNGLKENILVMNPEATSFKDVIKYKLEPVIYSFDILDKFIRFLINEKLESYPIHIELDTGMHRLGFLPKDCQEIIQQIKSQPEVKIASIFSHLAASDDMVDENFTKSQIKLFEDISSEIESTFNYPILKHISNTAGIENYTSEKFDLSRLGLGLYGISPRNELELDKVCGLYTEVSQIKEIGKGESVGYSRSEVLSENKRIGIIPIGYADGFPRLLSNGKGYVLINDTKCKVLGRVCMDMTMVDLSEIECRVGDKVEVFGDKISLEEFAKNLNTIPYEVLTSISDRVKRVYIEE